MSQDFPARNKTANNSKHLLTANCLTAQVEPPSQQGITDLLRASPLARVTYTKATGNVLIFLDTNIYGEPTAQPQHRRPPIPRKTFSKFIGAVLEARSGIPDPPVLQAGDIYACIDGGKERRRLFTKPFGAALKGDKGNKTVSRKIVMHFSEESYVARRKTRRGTIRLTQNIHVVYSAKSDLPHKKYNVHSAGSNHCDLLGPVVLDTPESLPKMIKKDKNAYWGKRKIAVGGPGDEDSDPDNNDGSEDDHVEEEQTAEPEAGAMVPIAYHMLPSSVLCDIVGAFNVRHVIDFAPTPGDGIVKLLAGGVSYVGLCGSESMVKYLQKTVIDGVRACITDPQSTLYDRRLTAAVGVQPPNTPKPPPQVPKTPTPKPPPPVPLPGPAAEGDETPAGITALLEAARAKMAGLGS